MKTLYITTFLFAGIVSLHAQENKTVEKQDEIISINDSKVFEQKMMKQTQEKKAEPQVSRLASEQGSEQQNKVATPKPSSSSGKLVLNTASFEEILASVPNRKVVINASPKPTNSVKGLTNPATLEEIKKTIPKN